MSYDGPPIQQLLRANFVNDQDLDAGTIWPSCLTCALQCSVYWCVCQSRDVQVLDKIEELDKGVKLSYMCIVS